jgi:hypothetical protein
MDYNFRYGIYPTVMALMISTGTSVKAVGES